jgi:hypothetical protein
MVLSRGHRLGDLTERKGHVLADGRGPLTNGATARRPVATAKRGSRLIAGIFSRLELLPTPDDHRSGLFVPPGLAP